VSGSNERHYAGTVQSHWVGIWYVKQMCLETGPEDSHRRCGSGMFIVQADCSRHEQWRPEKLGRRR